MKLQWTKSFAKDYKKLPQQLQKRTNQKLGFLLDNIKHPSLRIQKIKGEKDIYEASVTMNYRIRFTITGDTYLLLRVGTHTEILGR